MASFLHVSPMGMQFNGPELGAWYAAARVETAIIEVRPPSSSRGGGQVRFHSIERTYRAYTCVLAGSYLDIQGIQVSSTRELYRSDAYAASQSFLERLSEPLAAAVSCTRQPAACRRDKCRRLSTNERPRTVKPT